MDAEVEKEIALEIAHVLFIMDIVGYSKLSINDQHAAVEELNRLACSRLGTISTRRSRVRLLKITTGDGVALVFYTSPEAPCAMRDPDQPCGEGTPKLQLRMGIHSGR